MLRIGSIVAVVCLLATNSFAQDDVRPLAGRWSISLYPSACIDLKSGRCAADEIPLIGCAGPATIQVLSYDPAKGKAQIVIARTPQWNGTYSGSANPGWTWTLNGAQFIFDTGTDDQILVQRLSASGAWKRDSHWQRCF